jgi:bile acid-coenzyme A ligase
MPLLPLAEVPARQAARLGRDRWCLRHGDEVLSWGELDERSSRRAHALAAQGVRENDLVVLSLPNGNALFELAFASWKLGATPAMVSANLPAAELAAILDLADPRVFVAEGEAAEARPGALPASFGLDHPDASLLEPRVARYWKVMTSGGSTGRPKLIVARQPAQMDPAVALLGLPEDSVILNPGPCHHNMPFAMSVLAMLRGCAVSGMVRFDALEALRLIERDRAAWVNIVPTMMRRIWALPPEARERFDLSSLKMVLHTAAPTADWLKRAWIDWLGPDRLYEVYGGTEGVGVTMISGGEWLTHPGSVGRPVGCKVRVLGPDGAPVPAGEIGEIFFSALPGAPREPFHYVGAEIRRGPDDAISLGDQGWVDEDGFLYVAGRRTDLILCGGENVYPAEVENVLSACEGVGAAVVIGLPDEDLGERVHAIIEPVDPARPPSEAELRAAVEARLERRKQPRSYEFVPGPLRDAAGKVRRSALRDARAGGA